MATSGQQADLPKGSLVFNPKLPGDVFTLPVLLPGRQGTIARTADGTCELSLALASEPLNLAHLAVGSSVAPSGQIVVSKGKPYSWSCKTYTGQQSM